jgi:foldase protein PrsA
MFYSTRKPVWRKSVLLVIAAVLAMTLLAACGGGNGKGGKHSLEFKDVNGGEVVATYKDGQVTQKELDKYLAIIGITQPAYEQVLSIPQFQEMIVEQYVSYKVLASRASKDDLEKARGEVDKQLKDYKDYVKSDENIAAKVKEKDIRDEDMATFLLLQSAVVAYVNSLVTDSDTAAAFKDAEANFAVSDVRHILVATKEKDEKTGESKDIRTDEEALARANEVKDKLKAGGDWTELAKQYSDDTGSKDKGGLYQDKPGSTWVEPFKVAAFEQEIGVIGEPVKSEFGYHVIQVDKREVKTYDQITDEQKEQIKQAAAYKYLEAFMKDEMPKQELKVTLPQPSPTAEGSGEGEGEPTGEASATPTPESTESTTK